MSLKFFEKKVIRKRKKLTKIKHSETQTPPYQKGENPAISIENNNSYYTVDMVQYLNLSFMPTDCYHSTCEHVVKIVMLYYQLLLFLHKTKTLGKE